MLQRMRHFLTRSQEGGEYAALDRLVKKACPEGRMGEKHREGNNLFVSAVVDRRKAVDLAQSYFGLQSSTAPVDVERIAKAHDITLSRENSFFARGYSPVEIAAIGQEWHSSPGRSWAIYGVMYHWKK